MSKPKSIDVWRYWDGVMEGVVTKADGTKFYIRLRGDDLYPEEKLGRVYDAWLVLRPITPENPPTRKPDSIIYERDLRDYDYLY